MTQPLRIKLSRKRGWRLQEHSRKINGLPARAVTRPGCFGNPYKVGRDGTRRECVDRFRADLEAALAGRPVATGYQSAALFKPGGTRAMLDRLRRHNLACHCSLHEACHADVLLELANREGEPP